MYAANDGSRPFAAQIASVIPRVDVFDRPEESALFFIRLVGGRARCSALYRATGDSVLRIASKILVVDYRV